MHTRIGRTSFVLAGVVGLGALVGLAASAAAGCKSFDADPVPTVDASADADDAAKPDVIVGPTCLVAGDVCGSCCEGYNCIDKKCCGTANARATKGTDCCEGPSYFHNDGYCRKDVCTNAGEECTDPGACCAGTSCAYDQATSPNTDRCLAGACLAEGADCNTDTSPCCRLLRCDIGTLKCVKR